MTSGLQPKQSALRSALTVVGALVSQAAVLVPVLYYFGAVYTRSWSSYFGIDPALLGLTIVDFLRRSITPVFWPVVMGMMVLLVLMAMRGAPAALARRTRHERLVLRLWHVLTIVSGELLLVLSPTIRICGVPPWFPHNIYLLPLSLVLGSLILGYATMLRVHNPGLWRAPPPRIGLLPPRPVPEANRSVTVVIMVVLFTLAMAGSFWAVGFYASERGLRDAREMTSNRFRDLPSVVLFSAEGLAITGPGVETREIYVPGEKYRFYYSGIRLFHQTADAYFLIPRQWEPGNGRVLIIPRAEGIRLDLDARHGK